MVSIHRIESLHYVGVGTTTHIADVVPELHVHEVSAKRIVIDVENVSILWERWWQTQARVETTKYMHLVLGKEEATRNFGRRAVHFQDEVSSCL